LNTSVARWLAGNPGGAILVTALLALLPGLAFLLPGALLAFVTLQRGPRVGAMVAIGAAMLLAALSVWSLDRPLAQDLLYPVSVLGPPLVLAVVLGRSQSLSLCLQIGVLLGIGVIVVLHASSGDPAAFWQPFRREFEQTMQQHAMPKTPEFDALLDTLGRRLWGWIAAQGLVLAMCAVFLGRKWQASQVQPGSFGAEFRTLRLGLALGAVSAVFIGLSIWLDNAVVDEIAIVFFAALLLVGLAAAHRFRAQSGLHVVWLWVIYIGLVVVMPLMVAILATWGFVDNLLRSRPAPVASRA
jgi:hypothetical protein